MKHNKIIPDTDPCFYTRQKERRILSLKKENMARQGNKYGRWRSGEKKANTYS